MSWIQKLYRTYNEIEKNTNLSDLEKEKLAPLWHSPQTAHIQITLDGDGKFLGAKVLTDKPIIMLPVTESSEGRTSGLAPHALADSLQYIAKDLGLTYQKEVITESEGKNGKKKKTKTKQEDLIFNLYADQLDKWCTAIDNKKVLAIQKYIHKGTVLTDLIERKVIPVDDNGELLTNWSEKENKDKQKPELFNVLTKEQGKFEIRKALVVWSVQIPGDVVSETWKDKEVQQSWGNYYQQTLKSQFCTVTGDEQKIRESHPAKLLYSGDKAKLISSNDKEGFTYLGRFEEANQATTISAEVSHKAHAALRWLIDRQTTARNNEQVTVAWAISDKPVPSPMKDISSEIDWDNLDISAVENPDEFSSQTSSEQLSPDWSVNIGRAAAQIIKKKLHGYQAELKDHEQISLIMLDSATPGRMALTYYQEFLPADYFANLDAWIDDFSWYQRYSIEVQNGKKNDKRTQWRFVPPSPYSIAEAVYGKSLSDTLKKQLYARLLPVIAGGTSVPIPEDLVRQSFQAACNPNGCENWEWQRNIGVACALYKGWRARHHDLSQRRTYPMSLDTQNRSRDYIFGRLLAIAEHLERTALRIANETRATNAENYMQRFVMRPFHTWEQLETNLKPYKDRLRKDYPVRISEKFVLTSPIGFLNNRENEINQLICVLDDLKQEGCDLDKPLEPEFLLGYHSQKMAYRNKSNQPEQEVTETHE
ncbi:CRISPR-associated protein, Csd1 family [Aggregatibacter sp. oral taxon 458 str. W10330]|uniref:type I-C CRISPR-associated protein Cas8c/Csd1 n=1 Tax=Aggregatibacter sp. oral taxon 458 TaxID=712148 RepID=UPI00039740AE|nr:type I-C CRISPR-associated protein Cas8c/Csd1 [Aggregatibacter sp. oral taxon 458]ERH28584.1 CRISPR-associated protein, Csd1 family [Aggregatibacter sp. oral taxon 458 str. W10330]